MQQSSEESHLILPGHGHFKLARREALQSISGEADRLLGQTAEIRLGESNEVDGLGYARMTRKVERKQSVPGKAQFASRSRNDADLQARQPRGQVARPLRGKRALQRQQLAMFALRDQGKH